MRMDPVIDRNRGSLMLPNEWMAGPPEIVTRVPRRG
jgi:hypothetical protein